MSKEIQAKVAKTLTCGCSVSGPRLRVGTRDNFGFALYRTKGSDSLVAVMRLIYIAAPGCVVNSAKVIWSLEFVGNAWRTVLVLSGW